MAPYVLCGPRSLYDPILSFSWYWNDFCVWKEDMIRVLERLENLDACQNHYQYLWFFHNFWGFGTPFSYIFCHFRRVIKLWRNRATLWLSETENRNEKAFVEKFLLLTQKYENFRKFCLNLGKKVLTSTKWRHFLNFVCFVSNVNMLNYIPAKFHVNCTCFVDFLKGGG